MPRFQNLTGTDKIKDEYTQINDGFTHVNTHFDGTDERHPASDINNDSTVTGANVDDALETLKSNIDALVLGDANATIGVYSINASGTNTLTGTFTDLTYFVGLKINLTIANNNTSAVTFNLNGLGAKAIKKIDGNGAKINLDARDLLAGKYCQLEYDGIDFVYINADDVATYSAEQVTQSNIVSLPSFAQQGEVDGVIAGQTVVNGVKNGDFADGTTDWLTSASTNTASNNILTNTADGTNNSGYSYTTTNFKNYNGAKIFVKATVKVTNSDCNKIRLFVSNGTTGFTNKEQSNPIQNQLYNLYGTITTNTDGSLSNLRVYVAHHYEDSATANGKVMEVQNVMAFDITNDDTLNTKTDDELNKIFGNFVGEGIQHVDAGRVKAVGKNLFDATSGKFITGGDFTIIDSNTIFENPDISNRNGYLLKKFKKNTDYYISFQTTTGLGEIGIYTEGLSVIKGYATTGGTFNSGDNDKLRVYFRNGTPTDDVTFYNIQLEEGSTATDYEPYTETTRYHNKILKSLPNGTRDTIDNDGVYTKRVSDVYTLVADDIYSFNNTAYSNIDFVAIYKTNIADIIDYTLDDSIAKKLQTNLTRPRNSVTIDLVSSIYVHFINPENIVITLPKGLYADLASAKAGLAGTKLWYQLAVPLTEKLQYQPLQSQPNGTIYNEPITKQVLNYDAGLTLPSPLYLAEKTYIDSVYLIDDMDKTPIDLADVTVASATSITISGATDDTQYEIVYQFADSTLPQFNFTYPLDDTAQLDDTSKVVNKLSTKVEEHINYQNAINVLFDARLTALEP